MKCVYPQAIKKAAFFFITLFSALFIVPSFAAAKAHTDNHIVNRGLAAVAPQIYSVYPMQGYIGDTLTITGRNFTNTLEVYIGLNAPAIFEVVSDSVIKAVVPANASNPCYIYIYTNDFGFFYGFQFLGEDLRPKITSSPYENIIAGLVVDIYGEHFTGATAVAFGGTPATSFTVIDDGHLQAVVGNGSSGPVTITTPHGSVSGLSLQYTPPDPVIRYFTPMQPYTEGDRVTLAGWHFNRVAQVLFGGTPAKSFTIANDSTIYAVVDTGSTGAVKVIGIGGSSTQVGGFEYRPYDKMPPRVYSVYPKAAAAGQKVTLKGKYLSTVSLVYLGFGVPHQFTVTSDTTVETIVTPQDTGNWGYVETANGAWYFNGFKLLQQPATPVLDNATPMSATAGDTVYIHGDSLIYVTNVSFGSAPATSFIITSDTTITAIVGAGSSGNITVTTPGGSASLPGFTYVTTFMAGKAVSDLRHVGIGQSRLQVTKGESNTSISVYPNPAAGITWVKHPASANAKIKVINVMGGLVKFINVASGAVQTQLSLGNLPPGYYKVTWINGGDSRTSTIIVQ